MVRQVELSLPLSNPDFISEVFNCLMESDSVHRLRKFAGAEDVRITFSCVDKKTDEILHLLHDIGVGVRAGFINVMELQATIPRITTSRQGKQGGRKYNVSDRLSAGEIYTAVESKIHLTFDYLAMVIVAALIAAVGLIQADSAIVVASMIVSPLMNPILGLTLGVSIRDKEMIWISLRNEIVGVAICLLVGMATGAVVCPFYRYFTWPTESMLSRGTAYSLIGGVFVAIPSGVGVAIAITGNISPALVGVAISAALLPPIVNSGMNFAYGIVSIWIRKDPAHGLSYLEISGYSLILFCINFLFIFLVAGWVFRLKTVTNSSARFASSLNTPLLKSLNSSTSSLTFEELQSDFDE